MTWDGVRRSTARHFHSIHPEIPPLHPFLVDFHGQGRHHPDTRFHWERPAPPVRGGTFHPSCSQPCRYGGLEILPPLQSMKDDVSAFRLMHNDTLSHLRRIPCCAESEKIIQNTMIIIRLSVCSKKWRGLCIYIIVSNINTGPGRFIRSGTPDSDTGARL